MKNISTFHYDLLKILFKFDGVFRTWYSFRFWLLPESTWLNKFKFTDHHVDELLTALCQLINVFYLPLVHCGFSIVYKTFCLSFAMLLQNYSRPKLSFMFSIVVRKSHFYPQLYTDLNYISFAIFLSFHSFQLFFFIHYYRWKSQFFCDFFFQM